MSGHRRELSIRNLLLLTIGILTAFITVLVASETYEEWKKLNDIQSLKEATILSDQLFDAAGKLAIERDVTYSILYAPDDNIRNTLYSRLANSRKETDAGLDITLQSLETYKLPELPPQLQKIQTQRENLRKLRMEVDEAIAQPMRKRDSDLSKRWFADTTDMILLTQDLWMGFIKYFTDIDPVAILHIRFKHFLGGIMEYSGRERALIGRLIVDNATPTPAEQAQLLQWQGIVNFAWTTSDSLANQGGLYPAALPYFKDARSHYASVYGMVQEIFYIPGKPIGAPYPISVDFWLELATQTTESLHALKDAALHEARKHINILEAQVQKTIVVNAVLLLLAFLLCFYSFRIIIGRVIVPVNEMIQALIDATEGKTVSITSSAIQRDEIGRLARVLHAFQQRVEEIKRYAKELERSNKELDDFSYIASHDLKEPLRGIHNHSRFLLEDNQDKLDEESVSRLNRLIYLSKRMELLVNDLLYFSRLGRQEMGIQLTNINAVIHDIESTLDVFLAEHHASITIATPLPKITCDTVRVTELFRNLITNAIKYNDKEEKIVEIGFTATGYSPEGTPARNIFYVKDNGEGIAPEFHEEIFRIFKRLKNNKDQKDNGTGVGLTFVKKIIERHGGKIWLTSELGKETVFYFTLEEHKDNKNGA